MNRSEAIGQLAASLAKAQAAFLPVTKDRLASIKSRTGDSFRYNYADLATVVGAIKAALSANGLAVMQPVTAGDGHVVVTTLLAHASGEWISSDMTWPVVNTDNRSIGSGITYARRHSLLAMVGGAATDEDDDAESARGGDHDTQRPEHRPTQPAASETIPPGTALWGRLKKRDGDKASMAWSKAAKEALGAQPPPADQWTPEQAHKVELILFPIADRGPNP